MAEYLEFFNIYYGRDWDVFPGFFPGKNPKKENMISYLFSVCSLCSNCQSYSSDRNDNQIYGVCISAYGIRGFLSAMRILSLPFCMRLWRLRSCSYAMGKRRTIKRKQKKEWRRTQRKRGEEREELRYEPFCFGIGINALGCSLGKEIKWIRKNGSILCRFIRWYIQQLHC